jgi:hypothetical protein
LATEFKLIQLGRTLKIALLININRAN